MANYDYQEECLKIIAKHTVGKIILPTGSGKTRIEAKHAISKMIRNDGIHQITVVLAPRIILCAQLIREFCEFVLKEHGDITETFTFVNSDAFPKDIKIPNPSNPSVPKYLKGKCTTDPKEIFNRLKVTNEKDRDSVIISTYASFEPCMKGIKKALKKYNNVEVHLVADEEHYLTRGKEELTESNTFRRPFSILKENKNLFKTRFFFTATPKVTEDEATEKGAAMNNTTIYGDDIFVRIPKDLIPKGVICTPILHKVVLPKESNIAQNNLSNYAGDLIFNIYREHERIINLTCGDPGLHGKIGGKVLIAISGSDQLRSLIKNGFVEKAQEQGINVAWTMSVEDIGTQVDKLERTMNEFLTDIKKCCYNEDGSMNDSVRLMVLHYDQLTEGIDVPSMTGLIVLRPMSPEKRVQSIGRVMRVHPADRDREYSNLQTWTKPYSYIMVPDLEDIGSVFEDLVDYLKDDYGPRIKISEINIATGKNDEQPEIQTEEHKIDKYKTIHGKVRHEIEVISEWERMLMDQIKNGGLIDPTF